MGKSWIRNPSFFLSPPLTLHSFVSWASHFIFPSFCFFICKTKFQMPALSKPQKYAEDERSQNRLYTLSVFHRFQAGPVVIPILQMRKGWEGLTSLLLKATQLVSERPKSKILCQNISNWHLEADNSLGGGGSGFPVHYWMFSSILASTP